MRFKRNTIVIFNALTEFVFPIVDVVYRDHGSVTDAVLTSGIDGAHGERSFHYQGRAWDFRVLGVDVKVLREMRTAIWQRLNNTALPYSKRRTLQGKKYDVVLETTHFHIEFDER